MFERIRFLLLQVRNPDDPMREHEVASFARTLETTTERMGLACRSAWSAITNGTVVQFGVDTMP